MWFFFWAVKHFLIILYFGLYSFVCKGGGSLQWNCHKATVGGSFGHFQKVLGQRRRYRCKWFWASICFLAFFLAPSLVVTSLYSLTSTFWILLPLIGLFMYHLNVIIYILIWCLSWYFFLYEICCQASCLVIS